MEKSADVYIIVGNSALFCKRKPVFFLEETRLISKKNMLYCPECPEHPFANHGGKTRGEKLFFGF